MILDNLLRVPGCIYRFGSRNVLFVIERSGNIEYYMKMGRKEAVIAEKQYCETMCMRKKERGCLPGEISNRAVANDINMEDCRSPALSQSSPTFHRLSSREAYFIPTV